MNNIKLSIGIIAFLILSSMYISANDIKLSDLFNSSNETKSISEKTFLLEDEEFNFARAIDSCYTNSNEDLVCRVEFSNDKKLVSIETLQRDLKFLKNKKVILSVRKENGSFCLSKLQVESFSRNLDPNTCSVVFYKLF